jgi:hypothetical protein
MADPSRAAASLKPDIRLAQAISMLLADLPDEQRRSFRTQREEFLPPTITDVMRVVAEVDMVARGKQKGSSRTFGPRLTNFLEAVQEFASIGEVVLGGSMSSLATSVWLIVRLTIMVCSFCGDVCIDLTTPIDACGVSSLAGDGIHDAYERWSHRAPSYGNKLVLPTV